MLGNSFDPALNLLGYNLEPLWLRNSMGKLMALYNKGF